MRYRVHFELWVEAPSIGLAVSEAASAVAEDPNRYATSVIASAFGRQDEVPAPKEDT